MASPVFFPVETRQQYYDRYRAEGRQVNYNVRGLNEDGSIRAPFNQRSLGAITVPAGRRYIPESCIVSSSVPGRALLFITEEEFNFWGIGEADPQDASSASSAITLYVDLPNAGSASVNIPIELPEGCNIAFRIQPYYGTVSPAGSMNITFLDVTNDNNFDASLIHLVAGDSLAHYNIGDWKEGMDDPDYTLYKPIQGQPTYRPPFYGHALWAFRATKWLRQQGISIRLVNKAFGGSTVIDKQFAQLIRGYYGGIRFDVLTVTLGANDAREAWTIEKMDYFKSRLEEFVKMRDELRPNAIINFITPWLLDDQAFYNVNSAQCFSRNSIDKTDPQTAFPFTGNALYQDPDGRTRLKIARDLIFDQMDGREDENIYVIDGFDAMDAQYKSSAQVGIKDVTFTASTGTVINSTPVGTVNDDIYFKFNSVNPALNEQIVGRRVHASGQGHANFANLIVAKWQEQPWFQELAPVS